MQGSTPNRGSRPLSSNRTDTSVISTRRLLLPRPGTRSTHLSNSSGRAHQLLGPLEVLVSSIPERKRPPYRRQRWQNDAQCEGAPPLIRAQRCGVDGDCCDREPRRCTRKMRHERSSSLDLNVPSACRDRVQGRALRAPPWWASDGTHLRCELGRPHTHTTVWVFSATINISLLRNFSETEYFSSLLFSACDEPDCLFLEAPLSTVEEC